MDKKPDPSSFQYFAPGAVPLNLMAWLKRRTNFIQKPRVRSVLAGDEAAIGGEGAGIGGGGGGGGIPEFGGGPAEVEGDVETETEVDTTVETEEPT